MLALKSYDFTRSWIYATFACIVILAYLLYLTVTGAAERLVLRFPERWREFAGDAAAAFFGWGFILFVLGITAALSACASLGLATDTPPPTPRELVQTLGNAYGAMLTATDAALGTGQIPASATAQIQTTSRAATDSYHAANDEALKCQWVNGTIQDATDYTPPDHSHCNPNLFALVLAGAKGGITNADNVLTSFGYTPKVLP